ncbi:MAG: signal peptidase I [Pseudomonadota bacterium]
MATGGEQSVTPQHRFAMAPGEGRVCPRNPWLAVLLSVCPGLGQHYAGHIVRGIAVYVALIVISWLAAIAFMHVESKISIVFLAVPFVSMAWIVYDAWLCAVRQERNYRLRWFNRIWIYVVVTLFLIVTVNPLMDKIIGGHVMRAFFMTSTAMQPTVLNHDLLLINKLAFPGRGDLALIDFSGGNQPEQLSRVMEDQLIRRVIALPGDTVEVREGVVWLNGAQLDEGHARLPAPERNFGPAEVPAEHYFVLSDHRAIGIDSCVLGFIERARIGGKITKVFWSWNFDDGAIRWERTALGL